MKRGRDRLPLFFNATINVLKQLLGKDSEGKVKERRTDLSANEERTAAVFN